jgi:hypothetical protein
MGREYLFERWVEVKIVFVAIPICTPVWWCRLTQIWTNKCSLYAGLPTLLLWSLLFGSEKILSSLTGATRLPGTTGRHMRLLQGFRYGRFPRNYLDCYHIRRQYRRVPTIDECYVDDLVCRAEANLQFLRDKKVNIKATYFSGFSFEL